MARMTPEMIIKTLKKRTMGFRNIALSARLVARTADAMQYAQIAAKTTIADNAMTENSSIGTP
jgi:hypothetical protein